MPAPKPAKIASTNEISTPASQLADAKAHTVQGDKHISKNSKKKLDPALAPLKSTAP